MSRTPHSGVVTFTTLRQPQPNDPEQSMSRICAEIMEGGAGFEQRLGTGERNTAPLDENRALGSAWAVVRPMRWEARSHGQGCATAAQGPGIKSRDEMKQRDINKIAHAMKNNGILHESHHSVLRRTARRFDALVLFSVAGSKIHGEVNSDPSLCPGSIISKLRTRTAKSPR